MFRSGGTNGIDEDDFPRYASFLALLSDEMRFEHALEQVSKKIWEAYNHPSLASSPNRFTQAICKVGVDLGFAGGDLRVLTAAASPEAFGALLEGKLLWKDSFALGHGEFAHSYQWLAAGLALKWGADTGRLYQCTRGRLSVMPGWVKDDNDPKLRLRPIRLWEYLVDCTQWSDKLKPDLEVAKRWVTGAVRSLCKAKPSPTSTHLWLEELLTGVLTYTDASGAPVAQLPGPLAIPMQEFVDIRSCPEIKLKDLTEALLKRHTKLLNFIAVFLVDRFPSWCALSLPVADGGSFRNANNVTHLARSKPDWFICAYETRRFGKLMASQNATLIGNIKEVILTCGMIRHGNCELTLHSDKQGPLVVKIPGQMAFVNFLAKLNRHNASLASAETARAIREDFWDFVAEGLVDMSNTQVKKLTGPYQRAILSYMDALALGRQRHYASGSKTGQGWTTPTGGTINMQGIFSLHPSGQVIAVKDQVEITIHEVKGSLTKSVFDASHS
jgi:hypothetical protein